MDPVYLDHNATTPVDPEVVDAMQPFLADAVYVNYLGDEGEDRVRDAYPPAKYERLVALKTIAYHPATLAEDLSLWLPQSHPAAPCRFSILKW